MLVIVLVLPGGDYTAKYFPYYFCPTLRDGRHKLLVLERYLARLKFSWFASSNRTEFRAEYGTYLSNTVCSDYVAVVTNYFENSLELSREGKVLDYTRCGNSKKEKKKVNVTF